MTYCPAWALCTGLVGDLYGWYMLICRYTPSYHVLKQWYDLVHTISMVDRYIGTDWQGELC